MAGQRRQDGLADPPDRVRDELDALIGIELPRGGEQANIAFADQVNEGQAAILVLLGDRDDESQIALDEFLERVRITRANLAGDVDFLVPLEQRVRGDFVEVLVEDVALRLAGRDACRGRTTAAAGLGFDATDTETGLFSAQPLKQRPAR